MRTLLLSFSLGFLVSQVTVAIGQDTSDLTKHQPTILDVDPKLDHESEAGSFTSKPIGPKQKWQLDKGYFESDEKHVGTTPVGEPTDDYSGIRLRRTKKH